MVSNADDSTAGAAVRTEVPGPDVARAELRRIAAVWQRKIHTENFPVALRLLPRGARNDLQRIYAFARFVDDVGDESSGDRLALLDAVDADIDALDDGDAQIGPVRDLAPLAARGALTTRPLHDLVAANRLDQTVSSYQTFADLLDYCALSAAPVGRMVLSVAGVDDPVAIERSDRVCAALQVLEHCQDVREDAMAGRVYLPAGELRAAGVDVHQLTGRSTTAALRRVIADQVARSDELLEAGRPLVRQLHGWARMAVLGYVAGGRATSGALRSARFDVLTVGVRPSRAVTLGQALLLAAGR